MNKQQIKELALANGFKLKEQPDGTLDLNPYVYEFAAALKAHVHADILASTSIQIAAGKPEATKTQIAIALLEESKRIGQRAQEPSNANTDNQAT